MLRCNLCVRLFQHLRHKVGHEGSGQPWDSNRGSLPDALYLGLKPARHRRKAEVLPLDCSSQDFLWYPGRSWLGSGDAPRTAGPECSLRHCRPRHPPDKVTKVVRCRRNCACMDFIIYPRSTAISHFQRPSIRTDSVEIRRAAGFSLETAPLHLVYLGCHLHCRITWCRGSLLCRRRPTLPPLPGRRPVGCRSGIGWVHRESRGMDEVESAEAELRQDSILVAWIQAAVGGDRHKDHDDRWALHRIFDFRQESRRDIRQWTGNGPACQQHHSKLFLSVETAEIHPTITFHGCRENIGPFPHIKSCRLLQQYLLRCHKRCRKKTAIRPQRCSQADLEQEEVRPYHSCAEGSAPLASHPSAYRLQDCGRCLQRPPWSRSDVPQLHLQSCLGGGRQGSPAFCSSRRSDCASGRDPSLWPGGFRVSGPVVWNSLPGTFGSRYCRWSVSGLCWGHICFAKHMPSGAHSAFVTWLRGA